MGEDDLFDIFPDMDLDGDHDLIDFLILDEIENEIQKAIVNRPPLTSTEFASNRSPDSAKNFC